MRHCRKLASARNFRCATGTELREIAALAGRIAPFDDPPAVTARQAHRRLRPTLMTTCTTVAGMIPLALGLGEGSEMLQPLAVCRVFGLSFSVLVTLLLIPTLYLLVHRRTDSVQSHESPAAA
jgi:predicted exporter